MGYIIQAFVPESRTKTEYDYETRKATFTPMLAGSWVDVGGELTTVEEIQAAAIKLIESGIENGTHRPEDVRIVKIIGTFTTRIEAQN